MRKSRYYPFGYCMIKGEILPHKKEQETLQNIFVLYTEGNSYKTIAENLSKKDVPYHQHTSLWNKNMIKRILEDKRYLGGEYPQLLSNELFDKATKTLKKKSQKTTSKYVRKYKVEFVCGVCGKTIDEKHLVKNEIKCANSECSTYQTILSKDCFEKLIHTPDMERQQELTRLEILEKSELQKTNPKEEILIHLVEQRMTLNFELATTPEEITPPDMKNQKSLTKIFENYKSVIIYPNKIELI